jgi:hypothetical protein
MSFTAAKNWGSFPSTQLPNKAGATVQSASLRVGDTAYDTTNSAAVVTTNATPGAAVYAFMSGSTNTERLVFGADSLGIETTAVFLFPGYAPAIALVDEPRVPVEAGTLKKLRIRQVAGTGVATLTYTARVNGVNSALAAAIANTATSGSDLVNAVAVLGGDNVSIGVTKSAAPAPSASLVSVSFQLEL